MDVIEAVGLGKRYGRTWGLRDCTLAVPAGCVTGLVGPNGSGKTTLLSLAVGMIRPTAGTVRVAGQTAGSPAARALTAFVAQDAPLYQNLPVRDMLPRATLAGAAALLGAIGAYLAYTGWEIHRAYDAYTACVPASMRVQPLGGLVIGGPRDCGPAVRAFFSFYGSGQGSVLKSGLNAQTIPFLLLAVPVLLGAFAGGPALARELESGTFRFAWTQGAGRVRLAAARLVPLAVVLTAAAYGFSALFSWYIGPFVQAGVTGKYPMQLFGTMGTDFAAWTLFSFALTAFAGVLLRRTVPAMAASIVVLAVLDVVTMLALRQHYAAPVVVSGDGPTGHSDLVLGNWFTTTSGVPVSQDTVLNAFARLPFGVTPSTAMLAGRHWLQWWSYEPASRWWQFQLTEGGWLLAASLLLIAAAVLLIRRRPA